MEKLKLKVIHNLSG